MNKIAFLDDDDLKKIKEIDNYLEKNGWVEDGGVALWVSQEYPIVECIDTNAYITVIYTNKHLKTYNSKTFVNDILPEGVTAYSSNEFWVDDLDTLKRFLTYLKSDSLQLKENVEASVEKTDLLQMVKSVSLEDIKKVLNPIAEDFLKSKLNNEDQQSFDKIVEDFWDYVQNDDIMEQLGKIADKSYSISDIFELPDVEYFTITQKVVDYIRSQDISKDIEYFLNHKTLEASIDKKAKSDLEAVSLGHDIQEFKYELEQIVKKGKSLANQLSVYLPREGEKLSLYIVNRIDSMTKDQETFEFEPIIDELVNNEYGE